MYFMLLPQNYQFLSAANIRRIPPKLFAPADQSKCITVLSKALIFPLNGYTSFEMPVPDRGTERKE